MSILEIKGVTHNFKGLTALSKIDIDVREGEILGIIGPNGAGKTTLFNVISGFLKPTKGDIFFRGEKITGLRPYQIARKGLVRSFQSAMLFPAFPCIGNLLVAHHLYKEFSFWGAMLNTRAYAAREKEITNRSMAILKFLGMAERFAIPSRDIPYGYQKMIGIAMALATGADVLLLDEPVAGMNTPEAKGMSKEILRIRKDLGKTIIFVEHNMKMVMGICDRVIVIQHGVKIAEGSPDQVKNDRQVIKAYLGTEDAV